MTRLPDTAGLSIATSIRHHHERRNHHRSCNRRRLRWTKLSQYGTLVCFLPQTVVSLLPRLTAVTTTNWQQTELVHGIVKLQSKWPAIEKLWGGPSVRLSPSLSARATSTTKRTKGFWSFWSHRRRRHRCHRSADRIKDGAADLTAKHICSHLNRRAATSSPRTTCWLQDYLSFS